MGLKLLAALAATLAGTVICYQLTNNPDELTRFLAAGVISSSIFIALGGTR